MPQEIFVVSLQQSKKSILNILMFRISAKDSDVIKSFNSEPPFNFLYIICFTAADKFRDIFLVGVFLVCLFLSYENVLFQSHTKRLSTDLRQDASRHLSLLVRAPFFLSPFLFISFLFLYSQSFFLSHCDFFFFTYLHQLKVNVEKNIICQRCMAAKCEFTFKR